ncbi:MAG: class I SAM-dependent methyltransferase [Actinobacteria bacterium]|nr:class I SAM-dependent methyltransferase [Actinomycetota bacterium]
MPTRSVSIAAALAPLLRRMLGEPLPLRIDFWDGSSAGPDAAPCRVAVRRPMALRRMMWAPGELGLVRAYVAGDLDLVEGDVFSLLAARDAIGVRDDHVEVGLGAGDIAGLVRALGRDMLGPPPPPPPEEARLRGRRHSRRRDRSAISHHYDVGNDFYRLLLGPTLTYSCAYWSDPDGGLDRAQEAKYELICRKLGLRPGQRLLDVGCGWGGMVLHAARHRGVRAVGVTISEQQAALARQRAEEAGLAGQVEIRLQDYREVDDGPFDAISSIGMFEHVGEARTAEYFSQLHRLVRPGGRVLNHAISRPPGPSAISDRSFMGRYVFPDGELLEVGKVVSAMQAADLEVRDVESIREHYALTLRAWSANIEANWDEIVRLVGPGRARVWRLYVPGCALGFEQARISVHQVLAVRTPVEGRSGMPLDRLDLLGAEPTLDLTEQRHPQAHAAVAATAAGDTPSDREVPAYARRR